MLWQAVGLVTRPIRSDFTRARDQILAGSGEAVVELDEALMFAGYMRILRLVKPMGK